MKLGSVPADAQLRGLSLRVFQVLSKYTAFPWAVLQAQCKRAEVDPMALTQADLSKIIDFLADGVGRFSSEAKGELAREELAGLADEEQYAAPPAEADGIECPSCHARVRIGRFCSSCGGSLRAPSTCPKCGAPADGRFCSSCGAPSS